MLLMPYIESDTMTRQWIEQDIQAASGSIRTEGDLNYAITRLLVHYIRNHGGVRYSRINEVIGVLHCAAYELYRIVGAPYEDEKRTINGDVYTELVGDRND